MFWKLLDAFGTCKPSTSRFSTGHSGFRSPLVASHGIGCATGASSCSVGLRLCFGMLGRGRCFLGKWLGVRGLCLCFMMFACLVGLVLSMLGRFSWANKVILIGRDVTSFEMFSVGGALAWFQELFFSLEV